MAKKSSLSSRLANNQVSGQKPQTPEKQPEPVIPAKPVVKERKPDRKIKQKEKKASRKQQKEKSQGYSIREVQTPKNTNKTSNINSTAEVDLEDLLEFEELANVQKEQMEEHRAIRTQRIGRIILVCACVYMVFLIYGVFVTSYHYNENGEVEAQRVSAKELRELKEFEKVLVEYEQCRIVYEKLLMLDYRASSGTIDPMTLGPEYSNLNKKEIQALITKVKGAKVDSKYTDINALIYSWLNDCASVYASNQANYLETGQEEYLTNASSSKANMYNAFSNLTQNIVSIGDTVPGADMTEIREWDPQEYVEKTIRNQED